MDETGGEGCWRESEKRVKKLHRKCDKDGETERDCRGMKELEMDR